MSEWISCSESLPEQNNECVEGVSVAVTVFSEVYGIFNGVLVHGHWYLDGPGVVMARWNTPLEAVTHWMPLPSPPESEQ